MTDEQRQALLKQQLKTYQALETGELQETLFKVTNSNMNSFDAHGLNYYHHLGLISSELARRTDEENPYIHVTNEDLLYQYRDFAHRSGGGYLRLQESPHTIDALHDEILKRMETE